MSSWHHPNQANLATLHPLRPTAAPGAYYYWGSILLLGEHIIIGGAYYYWGSILLLGGETHGFSSVREKHACFSFKIRYYWGGDASHPEYWGRSSPRPPPPRFRCLWLRLHVSHDSSSSLLTLGVQMLQYIKHVQGDDKITLQTKTCGTCGSKGAAHLAWCNISIPYDMYASLKMLSARKGGFLLSVSGSGVCSQTRLQSFYSPGCHSVWVGSWWDSGSRVQLWTVISLLSQGFPAL